MFLIRVKILAHLVFYIEIKTLELIVICRSIQFLFFAIPMFFQTRKFQQARCCGDWGFIFLSWLSVPLCWEV